jgi:hypothetical protein
MLEIQDTHKPWPVCNPDNLASLAALFAHNRLPVMFATDL